MVTMEVIILSIQKIDQTEKTFLIDWDYVSRKFAMYDFLVYKFNARSSKEFICNLKKNLLREKLSLVSKRIILKRITLINIVKMSCYIFFY